MDKRAPNNATYYSHPDMMPDPRLIESNSPTKPLYMLIKVDVDPLIVYNNPKAHTYAQNHCNSLEYELVDWFYPNEMHEPCYPFIKL